MVVPIPHTRHVLTTLLRASWGHSQNVCSVADSSVEASSAVTSNSTQAPALRDNEGEPVEFEPAPAPAQALAGSEAPAQALVGSEAPAPAPAGKMDAGTPEALHKYFSLGATCPLGTYLHSWLLVLLFHDKSELGCCKSECGTVVVLHRCQHRFPLPS